MWKQLAKYSNESDNGPGLKRMVVKFLTNVLCDRWRSFYPETVGKWKEYNPTNTASGDSNNNYPEAVENGPVVTQILEIFATIIHESNLSQDNDSLNCVITSLALLQSKRGLFSKQIFHVHLKDFSWLLLKAWQSGNSDRLKDQLCDLLHEMSKNHMSEFVMSIVPNYLINESGVADDGHKKLLHDSITNNGQLEVALKDLSIATTFKFRLDQFINDARFYTSLKT